MANTTASKQYLGSLMLTVCAFIWGTAFIAQSVGSEFIEPLTFNFSRSVLASVFLLCCAFIMDALKKKDFTFWGSDDPIYKERLLKGGVLCGIFISAASFFQQVGIAYTTVGKSGFITALYLVIVPVLCFIIYRRSIGVLTGAGIITAAVGMYFICINESFTINIGDFYTLICAVCFALQIICIENVIKNLDGVRLSMIQFLTSSVINGILMFIFETPSADALIHGWLPLAYTGIMSSGVAFTLQIVGQKYVSSVLACMLMSLESAFALISGWLLLGQSMTTREIFGCLLVFAAIILAQVPPETFFRKKTSA